MTIHQTKPPQRGAIILETKEAGAGDEFAEIKAAFSEHDSAVTKRIDALQLELKAERERADMIETALNRPGADRGLDGKKGPTIEVKAFNGFLRRGPDSLGADERKALVVGDNTQGGYLAPSQFANEILKNLVEISPVRQAARVSSMSASEIIIPRRTGRPTAYWVGETETRTATQSAYGQVTIPANEAACYVDVSQQLLEDAAFSMEQELAADLAEEFGRIEGYAFVLGDGVKKPRGILASDGVTEVPSGNATEITADALINILYALPAFYRNRSTWMMNSTTLAAVRKLKDGGGQYLWQPGIAAGQPETVLGRPVIDAVDMPDVQAGATPIVVGDFAQGYRIMDRVNMSVLRDPYTMATEGLVRFHARRRVGADVVKAEALRKLKIAAA